MAGNKHTQKFIHERLAYEQPLEIDLNRASFIEPSFHLIAQICRSCTGAQHQELVAWSRGNCHGACRGH